MMRFLSVLFLMFLFSIGAYAEVDPMFDLDLPDEISFKMQTPAQYKRDYDIKKGSSSEVQPQKAQPAQAQQSGVKGFFSKFKKNKKPPIKFDSAPTEGYKGTLPDIESEFNYKNPKNSSPKGSKTSAEDYTPEDFQPAKTDDPLFLDVILNKGRPSQYTTDMLRVMKFLESFRKVVEAHQNVQQFNANVNLLDLHARRIEQLYSQKPEGMSPSYWMLLDLAYKAKVLGNLKFDANYYSKFSPVTGTQYDPSNILNEDAKLLVDIDKTIFEIRQLSK